MKKKSVNLAFCLFGLMFAKNLSAQEATLTSGGTATGSGGKVNYSIGQVVYLKNSGSNGTVSQGVQQAYQIAAISGVKKAKSIKLDLVAYPNPVKDNLILSLNNYNQENLSFQLFDFEGKILENRAINSPELNISMSSFPTATYFIKVFENNKEVKTFKIIKNN